jgi:hypothetical protein
MRPLPKIADAPDDSRSADNVFYITTPTSARSVDGTHPLPTAAHTISSVADATSRFLADGTIPPASIADEVLAHLYGQTFEALRRQDYAFARKTEDAARFLSGEYASQKVEFLHNEETALLHERLSQARQNLQARLQEWSNIFRIFQNEQVHMREELMARHMIEEQQFGENWSSAAYLTSFTKQSYRLLSLRRQQKGAALVKDFEGAAQMKAEADHLQRREAATAEERAEESMRLAYETMMERHRREIECFAEHERQTEIFLRKEKERAIEPIEKMIAQLEIARDKDKPLNLNPRPVPRNARKPRVKLVGKPVSRIDVKTFLEFRSAEAPEPLSLNPPDVAKLIPKIRARSAQRSSVRRR